MTAVDEVEIRLTINNEVLETWYGKRFPDVGDNVRVHYGPYAGEHMVYAIVWLSPTKVELRLNRRLAETGEP